jgi:two-component system sensor histidine kinase QseC
VAHELRTPIAELRAVTEVALTWPSDAQAAQEALRDTLEIATQMEMLVNTLLSLIRSSGAAPPLERIELGPLVEQLTAKMSFVEHDRDLELRIPARAVVWAHPALLASVLTNLFSNAIEYSSDRTVRCWAQAETNRWSLIVQNAATQLAPQDVEQMFEPFWRKDESRTGNTHCGLGLALVKAYCAVMRAEITASLSSDHQLQVRLTFAAEDSAANQSQTAAALAPFA